MQIVYRKELEKAAHQMVLIHRTDTLIRLIIRTVRRNLNLSHAGIFLYDKTKNCYILTISRGEKGIKIPSGLVKITQSSPIVKYFENSKNNGLLWNDNCFLVKRAQTALVEGKFRFDEDYRSFLESVVYQLSFYKAKAAMPIIFRDKLLGIFILGESISGDYFHPDELTFLSILSSDVAMAIRSASLFEDLNIQLEHNKNLFLQTVTALAQAIEAKDKYTKGHTDRVVKYSLIIAEQLRKQSRIKLWENFKKNLEIAALLHDIGKIGVPGRILNKVGPLNEKDVELIRRHPLIGEEILSSIKDLKDVSIAVKSHHERYDGKGYPCGLKSRGIPFMASIIAVADAFDAMTSDRPYRKAFSCDKAMREIQENSGRQFHPKVVEAFLSGYKSAEK